MQRIVSRLDKPYEGTSCSKGGDIIYVNRSYSEMASHVVFVFVVVLACEQALRAGRSKFPPRRLSAPENLLAGYRCLIVVIFSID